MRPAHCLGGAACLLLTVIVGCTTTDISGLSLLRHGDRPDERVLEGTPKTVALAMTTSLTRLRLEVKETAVGEAIHIDSRAGNGDKFKLILTAEGAGAQARTRLKLQWVQGGSQKLTLDILGTLVEMPAARTPTK